MKVRLCGGPKEGQWIEWLGVEVRFPIADQQWQDEQREWDGKHLLADAIAWLNRDYETLNKIPPKPSFPVDVYRAERGPYGVGFIGVYQGVQR